ncbi:hypothetical protein BDZ94DRAFT_1297452 [Collybia nuda]|uniref:Uncharacterized protein n=1 Tax=Collybia nuda TaxID=64659 RepID=A0A9P6CJ71_9AGAR|nr:hypothetical protein BDZ94DRAFT_1297452 [Collybia nuda]
MCFLKLFMSGPVQLGDNDLHSQIDNLIFRGLMGFLDVAVPDITEELRDSSDGASICPESKQHGPAVQILSSYNPIPLSTNGVRLYSSKPQLFQKPTLVCSQTGLVRRAGVIMGTSIIPVELIEVIIDLVHDYPATLKICALASHSFARMAQAHLFSTITLDAPTPLQYPINSCQKLNRILCESPHLAVYVQNFLIFDGHHKSGYPREVLDTCRYEWVATEETLSKVLSQLVNLRSLSIRGSKNVMEWENLSTEIRNAILAAAKLPQLSGIELINTSGFLPLLKSVTNLKNIRLLNSSYASGVSQLASAPENQGVCKPFSLETSIPLDNPSLNNGPNPWLDPSALRSITLQCPIFPSETKGLFFTSLFTSRTLEHIQLHLPSPMPFSFLTDLSQFPHLRSFYIDFRGNDPTHRLGYVPWLIQLINTIPDTSYIETIAFQLSRRSPNDLLLFDEYAKLDEVLSRLALKSLRTVRAKVSIMGQDSAYRVRLPLINAQGILQIEPGAKWVTTPDRGCDLSCIMNGI